MAAAKSNGLAAIAGTPASPATAHRSTTELAARLYCGTCHTIDASSELAAPAPAKGAPAKRLIAGNGRMPVLRVWCAMALSIATPSAMATGATQSSA